MFGRRETTPPPERAPQSPSTPAEQPRIAPRSPNEAIKPQVAPPPPPRRIGRPRGGLLATLSGLFSLLAITAVAALVALFVLAQQANAPGPLTEDRVLVVPRNSGMGDIAQLLRREGIIEQPLLFQAYAVLNRQQGRLRAGEFMFRANASIKEAIEVLTEGRAVLYTVTIPEGLTSFQIVERLRQNEILVGEIAEIPPEGSLLPDTYKFERGMSRQQIVDLMRRSQELVLAEIWERRIDGLPLESPEELVILASIVERETGRADERPRVAGVFVNRLRRGMRLQSDPTIVYGLVGGVGTLGRGIRRSEIQQPTPWNTYVIHGLPPTPIANPGRAAMEAVANPSRTNDLFFVADGTGGHAFSETYEQHRRAVARWRQIERSRGESGPTDAVDPADVPEDDPALERQGALPTGGPAPAALVPVLATNPADVSEGTPLDPLANRSFDLDSPQRVPELEPLPGELPLPSATPAAATAAAVPPLPPPRPAQ